MAHAPTSAPAGIGPLLQYWRKSRSLSQLALAVEADVSARHVSFLETGRANPSREMVLLLADALQVPLRERNALLTAAGYAPMYRESALDDPLLAPVRAALDAILAQQEPYPAVVMNRRWDIVTANRAAGTFFAGLLGGRTPPGAGNVLRLIFHPEGLRPAILNWEAVARSLVERLHREAVGGVLDEGSRALLAEILDYPGVPRSWRTAELGRPLVPVLPVSFRLGLTTFHYFSTVTVLGTPQDVTLQEVRIECFFPADAATASAARDLAPGPGVASVVTGSGMHHDGCPPMVHTEPKTDADLDWMLEGGGASADLMRTVDWAATPLGPMSGWSRSLKATVATLLHSRHPMFLWWGPELIQIYNDAYVPSFGVGKHPAAMGQRGRDCWPEIWSIIGPQIEAVMERGVPSWHEDALVPIFRNGAIEEVYWTYGYSPVFDDDGRIGGTLVVCTETTGRVVAARSERELRLQIDLDRRRLQAFFAQAPAGICVLRGAELTFESANDHYRALIGGRELLGKPLLEALPELRGQGLDGLLRRVIETGEPYVGREVPVRIDRRGAGVPDDHFYTFIYSPLREAEGRSDAVIVLALDVTAEVVARREGDALAKRLRDSEAQFHQLAESIPQLAWSARADGHVDWYNRRWYEYTGTTPEVTEGWDGKSLLDPEHVDEIVTEWRKALAGGTLFDMEFRLRGHDGVLRWFLTRAVPLRDEAGQVVRWFGTNTDIDASRRAAVERATLLESEQRARAAAEVASRAKDDFLATASHELRTPLNAILGWARLLQTGQLDAPGVARAIETIERNGRAQVRLIEDILDGSRIITGNLHLEVRPLDLILVVNAALDSVRAAAEAKRIALTAELDPAAARVLGDPERLQQVIWNLVNNAIKFTPKGGAVDVTLRLEGADVRLSVSDTGQGIDASFLPHVFERFRQAEGSTTRRYTGLGLGLALVRHLVEAHGGTVRAESAGVGLGARFSVTLPVQAVVPTPPEPALPARLVDAFALLPPNLAGVDLLVVDDEPDARDFVAAALRARGAHVTTAANAAEALALVTTRPFAAMVSDVGMPGTDGYELIRGVRSMTGTQGLALPAVALTAYSREEDRNRALAAGFQAYLAKPVEPERLVGIVAELVTERWAQAASAAGGPAEGALDAFQRVLSTRGLSAALGFLNGRTGHRYTGLYRFDGPIRRCVLLYDAEDATVAADADAPMEATYCSIVGAFERPLVTADAARDASLLLHPARAAIRSYCGVLLRDAAGQAFGTLCHFDEEPRSVPVTEVALMEAAAVLIMSRLTAKG